MNVLQARNLEQSVKPAFDVVAMLKGNPEHILQIITGEDEQARKDLNDLLHNTNGSSNFTTADNKPGICNKFFNDFLFQNTQCTYEPFSYSAPIPWFQPSDDESEDFSINSNKSKASRKKIKVFTSTSVVNGSVALALENYLGKERHENLYCWILACLQQKVLQMFRQNKINIGRLSDTFSSILMGSLRRAVEILDSNPKTTLSMLKILYDFFDVPANKWFGITFLNSICAFVQGGVTWGKQLDAVLGSIIFFIRSNYTNFSESGAWDEAEENLKTALFDIAHRGSLAYSYLLPDCIYHSEPTVPPTNILEANLAEKQHIITFMELLKLNLLVRDRDEQMKKHVNWFLKHTHAKWYRCQDIKGEMMATFSLYLIEYAAGSNHLVGEVLSHGLSLDIRTLTWLDCISSALFPDFNRLRDFKILPEAFFFAWSWS